MVTLLGLTALAVDVGMLYAERTQLHNGADAAALAIAQKCARNINDADCSTTSPLARSLANDNAGDGITNTKSILLDKPNGTVTVTDGAQEAGSAPNRVSLFFVRVLGACTGNVNAADWAAGDPGNSHPGVCDDQLRAWAADITAGKDVTVLSPSLTRSWARAPTSATNSFRSGRSG